MKLWQKIFLCSFALMIVVIDVTSTIIISNNHRMNMEREESKAISEYEHCASTIVNRLVYERLKRDEILLSPEQIPGILTDMETDNTNIEDGFAVSDGKQFIYEYHFEGMKEKFAKEVFKGKRLMVTERTEEGKTLIFTGAEINLEGQAYYLFTRHDITEVIEMKEHQLDFVRNMGLICAAVVAAILLILVFCLMSPLNRLNRALQRIAQGDYQRRVKVKGSEEFKTLASNVNEMALAIEEKIERIQTVSEGRKQFIDNLAHEMKTPLTSILGFADILRISRRMDDEKRQEYAAVIVEEAKRLKSLSGKLLELATTDHVELEWETITVNSLFEDVCKTVIPLLKQKELTVKYNSVEEYIQADKELIKSVLYNLIDNAAKASSKGQQIFLLYSGEERGSILSVVDYGIGMDESEIKKVTEPFYMVDKSRSRKDGGAGLGLALCCEIVSRHGGEISIRSQKGRGTCVSVFIPQKGENSCSKK